MKPEQTAKPLVLVIVTDVDETGPGKKANRGWTIQGIEDGQHNGPREQGGGGEISHTTGLGTNSFHIHRSQGKKVAII